MAVLRNSSVVAIVVSVGLGAMAPAGQPPASTPPERTPGTKAPAGEKAGEKKAMTPAERLKASAKYYGELKTYRDEGTRTEVMDVGGRKITSEKPFTTAFERNGRLRWEFRHSSTPGAKPDQSYTVWSADGKSFDSFWTLTGKSDLGQEYMMAFAGPTGVSGGLTMEILPLLRVGTKGAESAGGATNLTGPTDKGTEKVDGVECWKVGGKQPFSEADITLWIDGDGLIRKIESDTVIDPSKMPKPDGQDVPDASKMPKFTVHATVTFKPVVNEKKIEDAAFAPPKGSTKGE